MKLYFVRHGQSTANQLKIIANRDQDHPLTELGCQQAFQLAGQLREIHFERIYSSPIPRALETAQVLAQYLGGEVITADGLREPDMGDLEGRSDAASWKLHLDIYSRWWLDQEDEARIHGGESFNDVKARFLPFIDELVEQFGGDPEANLLLVGHAGLYSCMLPLILKNISNDYAQSHIPDVATVIVAENRVNGLTCLSWDGETVFNLGD